MQTLTDQGGKTVGYLYNNVILLNDFVVAGVILAHCVFTRDGKIKGKFFNKHLYNEKGDIIVQQGADESISITAATAKKIMTAAWDILVRTREHLYPWVNATDEWSLESLEEFLSEKVLTIQ